MAGWADRFGPQRAGENQSALAASLPVRRLLHERAGPFPVAGRIGIAFTPA